MTIGALIACLSGLCTAAAAAAALISSLSSPRQLLVVLPMAFPLAIGAGFVVLGVSMVKAGQKLWRG